MILPGSYTGQIKCPDAALAADAEKECNWSTGKRKIWRYSTEAEYTKRGKADEDRKQRI